jgi:hypothetical protein
VDEPADIVFAGDGGVAVSRRREIGDVEQAARDQLGELEAERVAGGGEIGRLLLDRDDDRFYARPGQVAGDLEPENALAGAAPAGDERRSTLRDASIR